MDNSIVKNNSTYRICWEQAKANILKKYNNELHKEFERLCKIAGKANVEQKTINELLEKEEIS